MRDLVAIEKGERLEDEDDLSAAPRFINDADYVIRTWFERKIHHTYPEPGGYNDQDDTLMKDWQTLGLYYLRAQKGIFLAPITPDVTQSWDSYMGD